MPAWPRDRERWIAALAQHPLLIQRPILLLDDGTALIARTQQDLHCAVTAQRGEPTAASAADPKPPGPSPV